MEKDKITKEEKFEYDYVEEMEKDCFTDDDKSNHINADNILIGLLNDLGYEKLTKKWEEVKKWYV